MESEAPFCDSVDGAQPSTRRDCWQSLGRMERTRTLTRWIDMSTTKSMKLSIEGPGDITVGLLGRGGDLLLLRRIVLSGDPRIYGEAEIPLSITTAEGSMPVVPVMLH